MGNTVDISSKEKFKEVGEANVENFSKGLTTIINAYEDLLYVDGCISQLKSYKKATNIILKPSPEDVENIITKVQKDSENFKKLYNYSWEKISTFDSPESARKALSDYIINGELNKDAIMQSRGSLSQETISALEYFAYSNLSNEELSEESVALLKRSAKALIKETAGSNAKDVTALSFAIMTGSGADIAGEAVDQLTERAQERASSVGYKNSFLQIGIIFGSSAVLGAATGALEVYKTYDTQGMLTDEDYVYATTKAVGASAVALAAMPLNPIAGLALGIASDVGTYFLEDEIKGTKPLGNSGYLENGQVKDVNDSFNAVNKKIKDKYILYNEYGTANQVTKDILISEYSENWEKEVNRQIGSNATSTLSPEQKAATEKFFASIKVPTNEDDYKYNQKVYNEYKKTMESTYYDNPKGCKTMSKAMENSGYFDAIDVQHDSFIYEKSNYEHNQ